MSFLPVIPELESFSTTIKLRVGHWQQRRRGEGARPRIPSVRVLKKSQRTAVIMTPSLYLCVDCGGSKTSAVVCDEAGNIRGRAKGGPSNFANLDLDIFISTVRETILDALAACSPYISLPPPPDTFAAAWFGVAGVGSPAAIAAITPILSKLVGVQPGPRLLVGNDASLLARPSTSTPMSPTASPASPGQARYA